MNRRMGYARVGHGLLWTLGAMASLGAASFGGIWLAKHNHYRFLCVEGILIVVVFLIALAESESACFSDPRERRDNFPYRNNSEAPLWFTYQDPERELWVIDVEQPGLGNTPGPSKLF
jgi:hypothetical protein